MRIILRDQVQIDINIEESGSIDFMAEIEDNINDFTDEVNKMSERLRIIIEGINKCTSEIERVKLTNGNNDSYWY
jgi:archaellum component FlaC